MYSEETSKWFSKYKRQLRDSIIQWSVYKYSLLINTELNAFVQHHIDRTDDKFVQWKVRRLWLLDLRARGVFSRRDNFKFFFANTPLNTLRTSTLNTTVHTLILVCFFLVIISYGTGIVCFHSIDDRSRFICMPHAGSSAQLVATKYPS
jgi:hypothetical protein